VLQKAFPFSAYDIDIASGGNRFLKAQCSLPSGRKLNPVVGFSLGALGFPMSNGNALRNYAVGPHDISNALIASGYTCLDEQAKALGLNRSATWTIVKTKHKLGRLHAKTTARILANPDTPVSVRTVVQQYIAERLDSFPAIK